MKKDKLASRSKSKSHSGKKVSPKRHTKQQKSNVKKKSLPTMPAQNQGRRRQQRQQKGKAPSQFNLYMKTTLPQ